MSKERNYKILYLEDQDAGSTVSDLNNRGVEVATVDMDNEEEVNEALKAGGYQAYLMDYRLTSKKGKRDAPELAGRIRTQAVEGGKSINAPIVLITAEKQLSLLSLDSENQEQFDFVMSKDQFSKSLDRSAEILKSLVEAYDVIGKLGSDIAPVVGITPEEKDWLIDYRLEADYDRNKQDVYTSCHFLTNYFVRPNGPLVNKATLAARLGVDIEKSGDAWDSLLKIIDDAGCRYKGILGLAYKRWWMEKVKAWWKNNIKEMPNFRYETAEERVAQLNKTFGLELVAASPIEEDMSHEYWAVCLAIKQPLDPADGYVCNRRHRREWEDNEYISVKGALEVPEYRNYLSRIDRKDIIAYGEEINRK